MSIFDTFDHNMYGDDTGFGQHDDGSVGQHHVDGYINDGVGHYDAHLAPLDDNMAYYHDSGDFYADHGNAHCILCKVDPLVHAHSYHAHPLIFGEDGRPLVHVDGYMKQDGTYVQEHYRTLPDGDLRNNLSTKY